MIKCPKCGSEHVSIVTKIESEQTRSRFFEIILNIAVWIALISFMVLIIILNNVRGVDISDILIFNTLTEITSSIMIAYITFKIMIYSIITAIVSGTVIMLMPYETHSIDKCICHQCECKWLREEPKEK